ncbi:unnamed protein product [Acanthoscelides obtectus]|uniref:Uncharacterized protein n=1 Tax=Acanthoscelides obtectus TaxID=200917 RepID=A0A9P0NTH5_ACAOB|nr:unnamed protein product [Acanthoscelides obtectus]CAK1628934.1 hypothetical protein AOBTE_LOCUS5474 [Acanthoscelides obtectus]
MTLKDFKLAVCLGLIGADENIPKKGYHQCNKIPSNPMCLRKFDMILVHTCQSMEVQEDVLIAALHHHHTGRNGFVPDATLDYSSTQIKIVSFRITDDKWKI